MPDPRVALLVIDDRGWVDEVADSFHRQRRGGELRVPVLVEDTAHELGFCEAIREGWRQLRKWHDWDYCMHIESDFRFLAPFDLGVMAAILDRDGDLAQIALKRGPHGDEPEGGFMAAWPDLYVPEMLGWQEYLRQDAFFTTNPCLYPRAIVERYDWPAAPACEAAFTDLLLADGWSFAYLGGLTDPPLVEHVGIRTGTGY